MTVLSLGLSVDCGSGKTDDAKMPASGTMMAGDSMAMMGAPMLPRVQAHLDSLSSATPAMHDAAMTAHSAVMDGLLSAMQTDLMHLGLHRDSTYETLADSTVRDLARIAAAAAAEQDALLHEHLARVRRLMAFYEAMIPKR